MAPSSTALALCVVLLLARRTDGESLLPTARWSSATRSLCLSPTAPGRLLCSPPRLRSRHGGRHAGQAESGAAALWSCSLDTFAGWPELRLAGPAGSCLLGAGHGQGSLLTTRLSSLFGSLKAALVLRRQPCLSPPVWTTVPCVAVKCPDR